MVPHDPAQLPHGDLPVVVGVEEGEGLLQAVQLGVGQLGRVAGGERFGSGVSRGKERSRFESLLSIEKAKNKKKIMMCQNNSRIKKCFTLTLFSLSIVLIKRSVGASVA